MIYRELVGRISHDQPVYGIQPVGQDGRQLPFLGLEEMATNYVAELRSFLPDGPYLLAGFCFAGVLAYEVAHQLGEARSSTRSCWRSSTLPRLVASERRRVLRSSVQS